MSTSLTCWFLKEASVSELLMRILRDLSEISRGGGGRKQREAHPQKNTEVLYFVKKKTGRNGRVE